MPTPCLAAFAQADITPDFPVEMIGCYRPDPRPTGAHLPLMAQVLLFARGGALFALAAIDSLGLTYALCKQLREETARALGTSTAHVMVNFSHTHSAPAPLSPLGGERYFALLREKTVGAALAARAALRPCHVAWSLADTHIGENRREGCTAVDERLAALRVADAATGAPIATLLRVSAHANILMGHSTLLSSDYFGAARTALAAHFGGAVMLWQGAAGNLKPVGVDTMAGGTQADVLRIAQSLLADAKALRFAPGAVRRLRMVEEMVTLHSAVPDAQEAAAIAARAGMEATGWLAECARLRAAGIATQAQASSIHFLFVNEGCLCGVPDEIFCEPALSVWQRAENPLLLFGGYTDGCTGYLPHRAEWLKGGYETHDSYLTYYPFHGHVMPFAADTAARLEEAVLRVYAANRMA